MKKFSDLKKPKIKRFNEADDYSSKSLEELRELAEKEDLMKIIKEKGRQLGQEAEDLSSKSLEELRELAEKSDLLKIIQDKQKGDGKEVQAQAQSEEENDIEKPEILGEGSHPGKLFSKLFESREMAHIYHLQVNGDMGSHAKHTALGEYYDGVLDFIDSIIEVFQGQYGIIEEYDVIDTKDTKSKDTIEYFNELARFIKEERKCINAEDTHLHNIIDEVVALVYRTLYKLKYTK
jgi:hypothetical protein